MKTEIRKELLDELIKDYKKPEDLIGETGLLKQLTKALMERALGAELTDHLGYEKHDPAGYHSGNSRNGTTAKTVQGDFGEIEVETPRDRNGSFEPQILRKRFRRQDSVDVCARNDDTGDPGTFAADVRRRSEPGADLGRHRRGDG